MMKCCMYCTQQSICFEGQRLGKAGRASRSVLRVGHHSLSLLPPAVFHDG